MLCSGRSRSRGPVSETPALHIHLIAVGGTGMAPLACLLQGEGHVLTGSDGPLYPPMSTLLAEAGIVPFVGFSPEHLSPRPDLVVVGNAVPRSNPEAVETERLGLPRLSMPEALARFFLADRRPLVVAGTHGKTTTSSMAAWVDSFCGADPGFLVGGVPVDLGTSFRKGGARFVIEGDEYNAAYFDRGAKFLHYKPETLVLTSVEHDHVDLYPTRESLLDAYERLVALVPERGAVIACADAEGVAEVVAGARAEVVTYGASTAADVRFAAPPEHDERGTRFRVVERGGGEHPVRLGVWGEHNAVNALAVWAAARRDGLAPEAIAEAFAAFHGVKRRQEVVADAGGITVLDDFAHHPTAVDKTLEALRARFGARRLVVCFEPRSLSAGREAFHAEYRNAFRWADRVHLAPLFHRDRLAPTEQLDLVGLANELEAAKVATEVADSLDALAEKALSELAPGDVVVTMSSGAFGGLAARIGEVVRARAAVDGAHEPAAPAC